MRVHPNHAEGARHLARLFSLSASPGKKRAILPGACVPTYGWLIAHPSKGLPAQPFLFAMLFRLGLPPSLASFFANVTKCGGGRCSADLDEAWHHFLTCKSFSAARIRLHDALNKFFADWVRAYAKLNVEVDLTGNVAGTQQRPGDSILRGQIDWLGDGGTFDIALFIDFVLPHAGDTHANAHGAKRMAGRAAAWSENDKRVNFEKCRPGIQEPCTFRPFALETCGFVGPSMANTLLGISTQIVSRSRGPILDEAKKKKAAKRVLRAFYSDLSVQLYGQLYVVFARSAAACRP